ncbi:contractile injection system tape measure protein [Chryseobacterium phocaeense]|uniref:contractile injection system tape measure protein n=1 Tax=Chryseobacterium phocaeense TaxID=1816690 RepID=UPI0009BB21F3|nr:contractile injection system tape measure protein [Chryseobacterium phocaeense]
MHLLTRNTFDIQCASSGFGKEVQNQLGTLLEKEFYPKLDYLFQQYDQETTVWNIDLLEINIENIEKKNWKEEIVRLSLLQIEEYLKLYKPLNIESHFQLTDDFPFNRESAGNSLISVEQQAAILVFCFLKTGILEQNTISKDLKTIFEHIHINEDFVNRLILLFRQNNQSIMRWIFSVPKNVKEKINEIVFDDFKISEILLEEVIRTKKVVDKNILNIAEKIKTVHQQSLWLEFLQWMNCMVSETKDQELYIRQFLMQSGEYWNISETEIKALLSYLIENKNNFKPETVHFHQSVIEKIENKDQSVNQKEPEKEPVRNDLNTNNFIENAGLVILHPFLKTLFEKSGLYENDSWKTELSVQKAVLLTQYLVTGKDEIQENELLLNKILCGYDTGKVINTQLEITDEEKELCKDLLEAVLEHWTVMGKSSVAALQETFLQRNARLEEIRENSFELWVEEKGFDILLDQLPWGIGMIKTPWMEEFLVCNW